MNIIYLDEENTTPLFDVKIEPNICIAHIDGFEVFRICFNPDNFVKHFRLYMPRQPPIEACRTLVEHAFKWKGIRPSKSEFESELERFNQDVIKIVAEEKSKHIAECITNELTGITVAILEDAIKGFALIGAIELFRQAGETFRVGPFKKGLLDTIWKHIKRQAGVQHGGARRRKGFK